MMRLFVATKSMRARTSGCDRPMVWPSLANSKLRGRVYKALTIMCHTGVGKKR